MHLIRTIQKDIKGFNPLLTFPHHNTIMNNVTITLRLIRLTEITLRSRAHWIELKSLCERKHIFLFLFKKRSSTEKFFHQNPNQLFTTDVYLCILVSYEVQNLKMDLITIRHCHAELLFFVMRWHIYIFIAVGKVTE